MEIDVYLFFSPNQVSFLLPITIILLVGFREGYTAGMKHILKSVVF